MTIFYVEGIINDVGGSGVSLGTFDTPQKALQHLLNVDPWSTTPEINEMWIRVKGLRQLTW